ncbi:DUF1206 domain-containing protein [Larsenimonas rhizosphaerae]|uniref:DUF1206 domain-containing protein n=1 Tax=Larsenimonas rhizosphaerae TaxID=2944682 RepID=A0AA41ZM80_9GAMM|nr:DUF1206 domain-containing protein [Larsenimonas rhizosphaerae]MCM2129754.1 DUF1206 domain-containing protein [Larsenimonas rhizosphaerae]MCX2524413.1 DUF1206 domain-containing protein [Larsenimonas rhizosphaerae]
MNHTSGNTQRGVSLAARAGYTAKGIVYVLIGGLSAMAAFGLGGQRGGASEAVTHMASKTLGTTLMVVLSIGLLSYTAWRIIQAVLDSEDKGNGLKGILVRTGFVISGLTYATVAWRCINLLMQSASSSSSTSQRTAMVMQHPGGLIAIGVLGIIVALVGLRQFQRAIKRSYRKSWHTEKMPEHQLRIADAIARWGLSARGVVFLIIGGFLCLSALHTDPSQAKGLGGALTTVAQQPFGPWLLLAVALGLIAYGGYCFVNARYRTTSA